MSSDPSTVRQSPGSLFLYTLFYYLETTTRSASNFLLYLCHALASVSIIKVGPQHWKHLFFHILALILTRYNSCCCTYCVRDLIGSSIDLTLSYEDVAFCIAINQYTAVIRLIASYETLLIAMLVVDLAGPGHCEASRHVSLRQN